MDYTIKQIADLSGISTRTLRYYDEIGLLKPSCINDSGYRIYKTKEVDSLQQILFFRPLDMKLDDIQKMLTDSEYNSYDVLSSHYQELIEKRQRMDKLILTVKKTLSYQKGERNMMDTEKFIGLKVEKLQKNNQLFSEELKEKYEKKQIEDSNKKWMNLTQEQFNRMEMLEKELLIDLKKVTLSQNYESVKAKEIFLKHKEWLSYTTTNYSSDFHICLGELYNSDDRFADYYNQRAGDNAAFTLKNIIALYA